MSWYASKRSFPNCYVILITAVLLSFVFINVSSAPGQDQIYSAFSARTAEADSSTAAHHDTAAKDTQQSGIQTPRPQRVIPKKAVPERRPVRYGFKAALVMNAQTGEVVFERNPHKGLLAASLTKMMLALLALERVDQGLISLSDSVRVSERASRVGESQIFLRPREVISFRDLMKAILIRSANDAAVAVAEYISGSTVDFIKMMNLRARQLGMGNTIFHNVHGLPSGRGRDNISSVYDMALLASELIKYPLALQWSSLEATTIRNGSYPIRNTNKLLGWFPGLDGLKTGFFRRAGFNIAATAKRGQLRLIAVIMGAPTSKVRFDETRKLLSIGFNHYQSMSKIESMSKTRSGSKIKRTNHAPSDKQAFLRKWLGSSSPTFN